MTTIRLPREIAVDLSEGGGSVRIESARDLDRIVRAGHVAISALEEIGTFDKGVAGERATRVLKNLNVWTQRIERIETPERANEVETVAVALFTAVAPRFGEAPMKWRYLPDDAKERWRAYAIMILDAEAILR